MKLAPKHVFQGLALALACWLVFQIALRLTPLPKNLLDGSPPSVEFLARKGESLRILLAEKKHRSRPVALYEISPSLIQATLSAEDKRFYKHHGIDLLATARAIRDSMVEGKPTSGASTITQQLIKHSSPGPRTISRKISEIWLAFCLESRWDKPRILAAYLNRLDYGNLQAGIGSASHFYFGKPASDLSPAESAFLAGLPKAPTRLNPHGQLVHAQLRQRWVLEKMLANGFLDTPSLSRAKAEQLLLLPPTQEFEAPHFVDLLLSRRGVSPPAGGAVHTTLDLDLTHLAERCLAEQLAKITDKNATSGAVVIIDNPTGEVLALAGSGNYFQPGAGQVNGAWIARSPGSALKPFAALLALENGANPSTIVPDVPTDFPTATGLYRPNNYNHRFYGPVSLRFALGNSLNVAAIQTLALAGGPEALHRSLRNVGLTTLDHPASYYGPGLNLGNAEVRLLELANAYATLARLGVHRPYRLLRSGNYERGERVFDAQSAFLLADILSDNSARAAAFGMNSWLSFDFPVACKTGTSSDYRDNLAIGYTPEFTVAVWVGNPDGSPMRAITGVTGAAPILHDLFVHLHQQRGNSWFTTPAGIQLYPLDPLTGHQVAADRPGAVMEKCRTPPSLAQTSDYDATGRVILSPVYHDWLLTTQNGLGDLVVASTEAAALHITQPPPGTIYFLDPSLPAASQRIALKVDSDQATEWSSESLTINRDATRVQLKAGRHSLHARNPKTGQTASTWIDVRE